jgi:hypothetical protein
MEAIVAIFELLVQLIVLVIHLAGMVLGGIVYGLVQGATALRLPATDLSLRRLQIWTLTLLISGALLLLAAIVSLIVFPDTITGLFLLLGAAGLLVVAGLIGEHTHRQDTARLKKAAPSDTDHGH